MGQGIREMLAITGALKGAGRGADSALITDGRFSGGTWGFFIGHVRAGGRRRWTDSRSFATATASASTSRRCRSTCSSTSPSWRGGSRLDANPPRYTRGVLGKYARLVQGAETGAVTNVMSERPRRSAVGCERADEGFGSLGNSCGQ